MDKKENKLHHQNDCQKNKIEKEKESCIENVSLENQEIEKLKLKLLENQKKINDIELRKLANIENIKKNTKDKIEKIKKTEVEKFLKQIIPIIDSLEDILILSENTDIKDTPLAKGIDLTLQSLLNLLNKLGVKIQGKKNEIFNPNIHMLVSTELSETIPPNHIISINKKGFTLNNVVLRRAMVIVSKN